MVIGEVGNFFLTTRKINYYSNETLLECDALIIDFLHLIKNTSAQGTGTKEFYLKRKKQLEEFLLYKKIPIIYITPIPRQIYFNKPGGGVEYVTFDFLTPIPGIKVSNAQGSAIEIVARTPFTEVLNKYKQHFFYNSIFENNEGKIIAETPHTKNVLGFYDKNCIFLPQLHTTIKAIERDFFDELIRAAKNSLSISSITQLPEWAEKYFLPNEKELKNEVDGISHQISQLSLLIEQKEVEKSLISLRKKIFTTSGIELEFEVKRIFSELGFEFMDAEPNRDDLIIKYNEHIAVIEIKGIAKTAAEKHAAQLEKWSANYIEKNGVIPKGILIVNTFKETPLNERNEVSFPDQMVKYSTQREHCLITTLQLLNLYYSIINNPTDKDLLIESLFTTVGIYKGLDNWQEYIKKDE